MFPQKLPGDDSRWRSWSRIPPDLENSRIEVQTADGQPFRADVMDRSVDGMALLLTSAEWVHEGDMLWLQTSDGPTQAFVTHIQPQGMFYRVGLRYHIEETLTDP